MKRMYWVIRRIRSIRCYCLRLMKGWHQGRRYSGCFRLRRWVRRFDRGFCCRSSGSCRSLLAWRWRFLGLGEDASVQNRWLLRAHLRMNCCSTSRNQSRCLSHCPLRIVKWSVAGKMPREQGGSETNSLRIQELQHERSARDCELRSGFK